MQQVVVRRHKVSTWIAKAQEDPHIPTVQFYGNGPILQLIFGPKAITIAHRNADDCHWYTSTGMACMWFIVWCLWCIWTEYYSGILSEPYQISPRHMSHVAKLWKWVTMPGLLVCFKHNGHRLWIRCTSHANKCDVIFWWCSFGM